MNIHTLGYKVSFAIPCLIVAVAIGFVPKYQTRKAKKEKSLKWPMQVSVNECNNKTPIGR